MASLRYVVWSVQAAVLALPFTSSIASAITHRHIHGHQIVNQYQVRQKTLYPDVKNLKEIRKDDLPSQIKSLQFAPGTEVLLDSSSKAVRSLTGSKISKAPQLKGNATIQDYLKVIDQFLSEHQAWLPLNRTDLRLNSKAVLITNDVQFFKFFVQRDQMDIEDAFVDFRFKKGKLVQVINHSFTEASDDFNPTITGFYNYVQNSFQGERLKAVGKNYRVVSSKKGYRLARTQNFEFRRKNEILKAQAIESNADIFELRSNRHYLDGHVVGRVYNRNYMEDGFDASLPHLEIHNAKTPEDLIHSDDKGLFSVEPEHELSIPTLKGKYVDVQDTGTEDFNLSVTTSDSEVTLKLEPEQNAKPEADQLVAQNMAYYHVYKMIEYAKKYVEVPWFETALLTNTNINDSCNAYWDGSSINFFQAGSYSTVSCANTALMSDVIYHEWGHGLDHNTGGIQDGAFSEGLGDIISFLMTRSPKLAEGFLIGGEESHIRDMSIPKIYPQDKGEVHDEGLIIGSTFYDLYVELSKRYNEDTAIDMLSKWTFHVIFAASNYTNVYNALVLLDDDNGVPEDGSPNFCLLNNVFNAHGLAAKNDICTVGQLTIGKIDDSEDGNGNGIFEPGETVKLYPSLKNVSGTELPSIALSGAIYKNEDIFFTRSSIDFGSLGAAEEKMASTPLVLKADSGASCGAEFDLAMNASSGERSSKYYQTIHLGKNIARDEVFDTQELPMDIPDFDIMMIPFEVVSDQWENSTLVSKIRIKIEATHDYLGDVAIFLRSPMGESITLYTGGGPKTDLSIDKDLTKEFGGTKGKGTWKLDIRDRYKDDSGTLTKATLEITPARYECQ